MPWTASKPLIEIKNVVATATLEHGLDLDAVCAALPREAEYRPEVFPGLVLRLKKPKTATLLFRTGRMVCTGARSEGESKRAISRVAEMLRQAGIVVVGKP